MHNRLSCDSNFSPRKKLHVSHVVFRRPWVTGAGLGAGAGADGGWYGAGAGVGIGDGWICTASLGEGLETVGDGTPHGAAATACTACTVLFGL